VHHHKVIDGFRIRDQETQKKTGYQAASQSPRRRKLRKTWKKNVEIAHRVQGGGMTAEQKFSQTGKQVQFCALHPPTGQNISVCVCARSRKGCK
jgi:hypothetical protein